MNTLRIVRIVAPHALTCFQCLNLGLPPDGIAEVDTCIELADGEKISIVCEECFERLSAQVRKISAEEEE